MNFKKESKKLKKFYRASKKRLTQKYSKLKRAHKLTDNDVVFAGALILIFALVVGIIFQIGLDLMQFNSREGVRQATHQTSPRVEKKIEPGLMLDAKAESQALAGTKNVGAVKLPILMYHRIDDMLIPGDKFSPGLTVTVAKFDTEMAYLQSHGYRTIGLAELYGALYENKPLPPKSVVITFDDGYADNYLYAFPILKKYNQKATFFVVSNFFGASGYYMTAEQIKEMSDSGMDIESHTETHSNLSQLPKEKLETELMGSRAKIEALTGKPVYFLAYPFGRYSPLVEAETKAAGYLLAVTTRGGNMQSKNNPFGLFRYDSRPTYNMTQFESLVR